MSSLSDEQVTEPPTATKFTISHDNNRLAHSLTNSCDRPLQTPRIRPMAIDFHSEEDECIAPEEYLKLNESVASTEHQVRVSAIYDRLYKYTAQVEAPNSVIAELTGGMMMPEGPGHSRDTQTEGQGRQDESLDNPTPSHVQNYFRYQHPPRQGPERGFSRRFYRRNWHHQNSKWRGVGGGSLITSPSDQQPQHRQNLQRQNDKVGSSKPYSNGQCWQQQNSQE